MYNAFATPWTVVFQAPLSLEFPRQEYWYALPFPPPRDLSDPGIKPVSPASPVFSGKFFIAEPSGKPVSCFMVKTFENFQST